ncbi:cell division protein FtsK [Gracilibacillus boraciitolerans JCM 21714]|uniref:Cell division protein FtsK n=1 Tax=Gracilibacillus boraciitolerans JCM 21714 TaxID=1298598 RepID=W4VJA6_9BACI|nr:cell division protein FtsK [Gracilibacillus boraciitolerans JCM 21714]
MLNDETKTENNHDEWVQQQAEKLQTTLRYFNIKAKVVDATQGPSVTRFEIQPEPGGVKVSKIKNLSDDIKLNMAAKDIRMEAPIPGKSTIGIEVPNLHPEAVFLQRLVESKAFNENTSPFDSSAWCRYRGRICCNGFTKDATWFNRRCNRFRKECLYQYNFD